MTTIWVFQTDFTKYLFKSLISDRESLHDSEGTNILVKISEKIAFRYFRVRHSVEHELYFIFDNLLAMDDNTNDT